MERKEWNEFRQTGLLWFINSILHLFGWAIVLSYNDNDNTQCAQMFEKFMRSLELE